MHEVIDDLDGDIYLVTKYYAKGSLGDIVNGMNHQHEDHNNECRISGELNKMITRGIPACQARHYFIDMLRAI